MLFRACISMRHLPVMGLLMMGSYVVSSSYLHYSMLDTMHNCDILPCPG